jgi:hypothetical protein
MEPLDSMMRDRARALSQTALSRYLTRIPFAVPTIKSGIAYHVATLVFDRPF